VSRGRRPWLAGAVVAIAVVAVLTTGARARRATTDAADAARRLQAARADAAEIVSLRARLGEAPPGGSSRDLLARVSAALDGAGIPRVALRDLKSVGVAPVIAARGATVAARRQAAHLTLTPLEPPRIGDLLAAWRREGGAWVVTAIHLERSGPASSTGYTVRLTLTAPPAAAGPTEPTP